MAGRVLHLLSQRPSQTGSGVTLQALVQHAHEAGWDQAAVVGVPAGESDPSVGPLPPSRVRRVEFEGADLPFPVPGMSDVMPYRSTCFSDMETDQLDAYRTVWRRRVSEAVEAFQPDLIHSHHVWLLSALAKEASNGLPVVIQSHATGLRQLVLCPHLADEVLDGCSRNDRFLVLHQGHRDDLCSALGVDQDRIHVVGAGYRADLFHDRDRAEGGQRLAYAGKYSAAKGMPWLLDAFAMVREFYPDAELHVAGSGAGEEADRLRTRMEAMDGVILHGQLDQEALADLLRTCKACVLPSFYEGVPLVLVEAFACGLSLVSTDLPGVRSELAPHLGPRLELIEAPRLAGVDQPLADDLPTFTRTLTEVLAWVLVNPVPAMERSAFEAALAPFTWKAVFERVERIWKSVLP